MELDAHFESQADTGTSWSVAVARDRVPVYDRDAHALLETASLAKVFLLVGLAERIANGAINPEGLVDRRSVDPVGDSGLWQHLATDQLPVADAATLVGAVSDNLATNVLIEVVGLEAVQERARKLAPGGSKLHDLVRDVRTADTPETLSNGCASDWAAIFADLHRKAQEGDKASGQVLDWLAPGTDLSMVASAFDLDPLSHAEGADQGIRLWNKTGTDVGVRADAGVVEVDGVVWSYAAICNWSEEDPDARAEVLRTMRAIGDAIRQDG